MTTTEKADRKRWRRAAFAVWDNLWFVPALIFLGRTDPRNGLGLLDGYHGATGKIRDAIGPPDLAIRDFSNVVFDHHWPD